MSESQHHPDPINRRRAIATVLGTLGGLASIAALLALMLYVTRDKSAHDDRDDRRSRLAEVRAADEKALGEYGWVDQEKGVVRLPIEVAMEKLLAEGIPTPPPATHPATQPTTKGN